MTAEELLATMRPAVREILNKYRELQPPSMHQRAICLLRRLEEDQKSPKAYERLVDAIRLKEFISVWHTVNILEYPENHKWIYETSQPPPASV